MAGWSSACRSRPINGTDFKETSRSSLSQDESKFLLSELSQVASICIDRPLNNNFRERGGVHGANPHDAAHCDKLHDDFVCFDRAMPSHEFDAMPLKSGNIDMEPQIGKDLIKIDESH